MLWYGLYIITSVKINPNLSMQAFPTNLLVKKFPHKRKISTNLWVVRSKFRGNCTLTKKKKNRRLDRNREFKPIERVFHENNSYPKYVIKQFLQQIFQKYKKAKNGTDNSNNYINTTICLPWIMNQRHLRNSLYLSYYIKVGRPYFEVI